MALLTLSALNAYGSVPCEKLLVFWQAFSAKILKNDEYAVQKQKELTARLGRPQEFIARRQIDPRNLRLERRYIDGTDEHRTQLILGYWNERRALIKIFWRNPDHLDSEIGGVIIQDFLSEMELAPRVYGMVLDADNLSTLRGIRSLPFMVDREVRRGMYMAVVMEYIPKSFTVPTDRFMPEWYSKLDQDEVNAQIARTAEVYRRLGIDRDENSQYLITESLRIYGLDFTSDAFHPHAFSTGTNQAKVE